MSAENERQVLRLDEDFHIDDEVLALIPAADARRLNAIPIAMSGRTVTVAVADTSNMRLGSQLRAVFSGMTMRLIQADEGDLRRHIDRVYSAAGEAARVAEEVGADHTQATAGGDMGRVASTQEGENRRLLRLILEQALRDGASDVHIEPVESQLDVRYRVDGKLRKIGTYPPHRAQGLSTLIKVDARMNSDNFLVPDSGVLSYEHGGNLVDIRVETAPTAWGTSTVLRLQSDIWRPLDTLGFSPVNETKYREAITQSYGVILLTGPTGSGKSTTLYASLREKVSPEVKIITLENPIEYKVPHGITQIGINEGQGMTFASGLRSILRQDPDIVLVGEIRDTETAQTVVDAAMTGHLVMSTLHTNDAPGAIPRLSRMGVEPFLLSSALLAVVAQRLVRRLCLQCRVEVEPDIDDIFAMGLDPDRMPPSVFEPRPNGCEECNGIGYSGRVGVHEVMSVTPSLAHAIAEQAPHQDIVRIAREGGMTPMRDDAFQKAFAGVTSLQEAAVTTRQD